MADPDHVPTQTTPRFTTTTTNSPTNFLSFFLRKLQTNSSTSTHLIGFLALLITASILLLLTGITITTTLFGLILFTPLVILSSPIWVPVAAVIFVVVSGVLLVCGLVASVVGGLSWMYGYLRGMHPPGSDRVEYARSRIYDTASHVTDYAREYGGYLQSKVKDAAPGA